MIIYKQVEIKNPLCVIKLDNGTELSVYEDRVESSDGEQYCCVEKEITEDEFDIIGWKKI